jgi:hypothetical protein
MGANVWERTMGAFVILLVCLISTAANADESYLCIGEKATGFSFNEKTKEWGISSFKVHKYIVKKDSPDKGQWKVYRFGNNTPEVECGYGFIVDTTLICEAGVGVEFRMNKINNRFLYLYYLGYWTDYEKKAKEMFGEGMNTPYMEIGKCSKI